MGCKITEQERETEREMGKAQFSWRIRVNWRGWGVFGSTKRNKRRQMESAEME
jgi:hypothetical protein